MLHWIPGRFCGSLPYGPMQSSWTRSAVPAPFYLRQVFKACAASELTFIPLLDRLAVRAALQALEDHDHRHDQRRDRTAPHIGEQIGEQRVGKEAEALPLEQPTDRAGTDSGCAELGRALRRCRPGGGDPWPALFRGGRDLGLGFGGDEQEGHVHGRHPTPVDSRGRAWDPRVRGRGRETAAGSGYLAARGAESRR